ncbi:MAG: NUDIX domain-containing protein, partial [Planctomycetes bacterium]|nr:NUDIX domain-containing protein [Planctomycetota bacterium]
MSRRTAAALVITRGTGTEIEVFLGERSPELRFFGGYWAMPGGTVDEGDRGDDEAATMQACARRELFEETGLSWGEPPSDRATLETVRRDMLRRDRKGAEQPTPAPSWAEVTAGRDTAPMRQLCRIETPPFAPVRYDTIFFHVP